MPRKEENMKTNGSVRYSDRRIRFEIRLAFGAPLPQAACVRNKVESILQKVSKMMLPITRERILDSHQVEAVYCSFWEDDTIIENIRLVIQLVATNS